MHMPRVLRLARTAYDQARLSELRARIGRCPKCGPTALIKLSNDPLAVRCLRCRSSGIHLALLKFLQGFEQDLSKMTAYEMSSRGPVFSYLAARTKNFVYSEYYDDVEPGSFRAGVQCQDVQALTFGDAEFDLCTSTEVFEHVPNDLRGFREVRRILRKGGRFAFTVPLTDQPHTVERAVQREGGTIKHLLSPEYHCDVIRGQRQILVFRDYGEDLPRRLIASGFESAEIQEVDAQSWWGMGNKVVVATA